MSEKQINIPRQISNTLNSVNKTISENKELKINVNSNIVLEKDDTLNLPSISNIFNYEDMRGAADSFALKKKYHDEKLLNQLISKNIASSIQTVKDNCQSNYNSSNNCIITWNLINP